MNDNDANIFRQVIKNKKKLSAMKWLKYKRVISLETQVGITSLRNKWANREPGYTGGGIRCLGGVSIPCRPVTPAVYRVFTLFLKPNFKKEYFAFQVQPIKSKTGKTVYRDILSLIIGKDSNFTYWYLMKIVSSLGHRLFFTE
jgi:hypothetical protein